MARGTLPPRRAGRRPYVVVGAALAAALGILGWRHFDQIRTGHISNTTGIAAACFVWLAINLALAHSHRDVRIGTSDPQQQMLDALRVVVIIPVFNEDPAYFATTLQSLARQTRLPQRIIVVDDGSASIECHDEFDFWYRNDRPEALAADYVRQPNAGKREAQARAIRMDPAADIYVTIDSDVRLDRNAIAYGLVPFTRRRNMSVAGMLLGDNHRANVLTRLVELGFVSSFLNGRAQRSALGSVTVNAGGFALYRSEVFTDNLGLYLRQRVMGRKVSSGDDAMMTRYALLRGRTVFQRAAFGYTLHPVNLKHLSKQRLRWARSYWWGSAWMLRNFPARRIGWWLIVSDLIASVWMAAVVPAVFLVTPARIGHLPVGVFGIMALLSYIQNTQFLAVRRDDESYRSQLLTYAMAPLNSLLNLYLGWVLTYVGLFTFAKTGWSTRQVVEVGLEPAAGA